MEIPGFVEEWEKAGKEGTKMKLIWNELQIGRAHV